MPVFTLLKGSVLALLLALFCDVSFEFSCWRQLIEAFLEVTDDTNNFVKCGHFTEEHLAAHFLIVFAPGVKMVSGWHEPERAGMERGVIHP